MAAVAHFDFHKELFLFTLCMKMSPLDESVESDPDLLGAEVGQSVFPNVERVDAGISLLIEMLTKSLSRSSKSSLLV